MFLLKKFFHWFDKVEDKVRGYLSRRPISYAVIGGVTMVLFWRGVWHTGDILMAKGGILGIIFYEPTTILWTTVIMLATGLFVSFFIGDRIILSGLKNDKKFFEKTEKELEQEEGTLRRLEKKINQLEKDVLDIRDRKK
jgi:uncharacterized protein YneF (UPF0154 family)